MVENDAFKSDTIKDILEMNRKLFYFENMIEMNKFAYELRRGMVCGKDGKKTSAHFRLWIWYAAIHTHALISIIDLKNCTNFKFEKHIRCTSRVEERWEQFMVDSRQV